MHIKVGKRQGLDLPLEGVPSGPTEPLPPPDQLALDVSQFHNVKFKLLAKPEEPVKMGQALLHDKSFPKRKFLSPAGGVLREVRRGLKRRLISLVIQREEPEPTKHHPCMDPDAVSREELIDHMCEAGLFAHIRMRPFNLLAVPTEKPKSIFVKAVESAPFVPSAERQIEGNEEDFAYGLRALSKLTPGPVHLVHHKKTSCDAFLRASEIPSSIVQHTVSGPHPCANHSLHIQKIDPILRPDQRVWTANAYDVVCIGKMLRTGTMHLDRTIAIAGPGAAADKRGYLRIRTGSPVASLIASRQAEEKLRLISGDPLMGIEIGGDGFLASDHFTLTLLKSPNKRQFLHFLRPGLHKYSSHRAYLSGQLRSHSHYNMTTNLHGEERALIDGSIYNRVMPLNVPTALLVKAVLSRDYDHAEMTGILEVDAEDFALPTFICPSKIEMVRIVRHGLQAFAQELFG